MIKRELYGHAVGVAACITKYFGDIDGVKLYYGGARGGNRGGPQVKVGLLEQQFPEDYKNFSLLYLLSGALYMPPWAISKLKDMGVKVCLNQNGVFYPAWAPDTWERENARMARAMDLSDHVFYQSEFCKKCADQFLGTTAKSYEILYNGVDTNHFIPLENKQTTDDFNFLISGNINHTTYYRLVNALDALGLARAQGLKVIITFAGILLDDLFNKFKQEITDRNLEKYFILKGAYSRADAVKIYNDADAYLMTKHNDPCPNVVLEALSCGLPILYSASGGVPELVGADAGIGLSVPETFDDNPVPSPQQIVDGMASIINNSVSMANAARLRAQQKFSIDNWYKRHEIIFKDLVLNNA